MIFTLKTPYGDCTLAAPDELVAIVTGLLLGQGGCRLSDPLGREVMGMVDEADQADWLASIGIDDILEFMTLNLAAVTACFVSLRAASSDQPPAIAHVFSRRDELLQDLRHVRSRAMFSARLGAKRRRS